MELNLDYIALQKTFALLIGKKKLQIIELLIEHKDENNFVCLTIQDICQELEISKPTVIAAIDLLIEKRALKRIKNGLYKLNL